MEGPPNAPQESIAMADNEPLYLPPPPPLIRQNAQIWNNIPENESQ
jgi:hypothetical protein